jgi:hypothetical protein
MYAAAARLKRERPEFPEKNMSKPSLSSTQFGQKLRVIREVLGVTQNDLTVIDPSIPHGTIVSIEGGERKTPVPQSLMLKIHKALEIENVDAFDALAQAAEHVLSVRKNNFSSVLRLQREELLKLQQDALGQKIKTEYQRLQQPDQYGIAFPKCAAESQIGAWEHGSIPSHPMMVKAIINATGATDEAQFYIDSVMNEGEINRGAFKKTAEHLEKLYKALIPRTSGENPTNGSLSMFAPPNTETRSAGEWEATAARKSAPPSTNSVG